MKTRVALCQLAPLANVPERNLKVMEQTIKSCSEENTKLCIFPEDFLYGIVRGRISNEIAGKKFDYWIKIFCKLAKRYKIDIIPGSFPLYEEGLLYNTSVYINSKGHIVNKCRKINLWLSERSDYTPSAYTPQCFKSILGKTVLIICWDIMDHNIFEIAIKQVAQWIIILSFWSINQSIDLVKERGKPQKKYHGNMDSKLIDNLVLSRVNEYNIGIIFCNFAKSLRYDGKYGSYDCAISAGHTQIATPLFQILKKINSRKESILMCDIPDIKQVIKDHEIFYGRREDINASYP